MCINDSVKAHCIVKTCLDVTCSVGSSTIEVGYSDNDGLCAALEIRTYGCTEDPELIIVSGLNADNGVDTEHIRSKVKCST